MIELKSLSCAYGDTQALNQVSLSVPEGQILGYLGPNGAGKTSTVRLLAGMMAPVSGTASVAGYDITTSSIDVKKRVGYVPESGALYQSLSPFEYLQFAGRLYRMEDAVLSSRIKDLLHFFELTSVQHNRMTAFSKGMKQKVVIASAIVHNPDVLLLDEPLNGIDINAAHLLKQLLQELARQGKTIFYCSHVLEVVENLCHRLAILNRGRLAAQGTLSELKEQTGQSTLIDIFGHLTTAVDSTEAVKTLARSLEQP